MTQFRPIDNPPEIVTESGLSLSLSRLFTASHSWVLTAVWLERKEEMRRKGKERERERDGLGLLELGGGGHACGREEEERKEKRKRRKEEGVRGKRGEKIIGKGK
jgi:hypothetical protein